MADTAILGAAGAIGRNTGAEFVRRGVPFRVVGRSVERLKEAFGSFKLAEPVAADLLTGAGLEGALAGARQALYAAGAPYDRFDLHPRMMRTVVDAALRAGTLERLIVVSSIYSYGHRRAQGRVTERHPREPETRKGEMRKQQEDIAMAAGGDGRLRVVVLHLPDFYGPHADLGFANPAVRAVARAERANWLGSVDLPHEFIFLPDAALVIADLLLDHPELFGQRYNLGGVGAITGRAFLEEAGRIAGTVARWRSVSPNMLRLLGLFQPVMRELVEMQYLNERPLVLDDSKLGSRMVLRKTPYVDGLRQLLEWCQRP